MGCISWIHQQYCVNSPWQMMQKLTCSQARHLSYKAAAMHVTCCSIRQGEAEKSGLNKRKTVLNHQHISSHCISPLASHTQRGKGARLEETSTTVLLDNRSQLNEWTAVLSGATVKSTWIIGQDTIAKILLFIFKVTQLRPILLPERSRLQHLSNHEDMIFLTYAKYCWKSSLTLW